ncbi:MAG: deoxyribose-phosphate aldolase [Bacteroidales bacterium]
MKFLSKFIYPYSILGLATIVKELSEQSEHFYTTGVLKGIFGFIDLTTLNSTDTKTRVNEMCLKVNDFKSSFPEYPNVAAICVYPSLVETVKKGLKTKEVKIASVAAGFPSSQTYLKIKTLESKMAVESGADEIDMVISIGEFLSGNYQFVHDEIAAVKESIENKHLKVILETGALSDPLKIWEASIIAMHAGADFIKTSTGKIQPAATPEAAVVMLTAIKWYHAETGRKVGFKPAGGISTGHEAVTYFTLVHEILGKDWLTPDYFRLGASSLANNILTEVDFLQSGSEHDIKYF